ncbi:hypothetical protein AB0N05_00670 [Nocardia sp. NPDC051030]|uniref:hypothetical protein n=1 Tax=Nocardia sp. NPDC051030 TaxID=3155162 RepID=UPI003422EDF5
MNEVSMGQRVPAVVGLYFRARTRSAAGRWRRIAEFRLTADGHATFRAVDPVEGLVARVWYHQGVDILGEDRTVTPENGPEFLRALLQPFGFRDYRFRDESTSTTRPGPPHGGRNGSTHNAAAHNGHEVAAHNGHEVVCPEKPTADADSERPAAWRSLDADVIRF